MRVYRVLFVIVLVSLVTFPAAAVIQDKEVFDHGCADGMNTDDCFNDPTQTASSGGDFIACTAKGGPSKQGCYHLSVIKVQGVDRYSCGKHETHGACSCNASARTAKGICTYYR
jgi:hypothetical protein